MRDEGFRDEMAHVSLACEGMEASKCPEVERRRKGLSTISMHIAILHEPRQRHFSWHGEKTR